MIEKNCGSCRYYNKHKCWCLKHDTERLKNDLCKGWESKDKLCAYCNTEITTAIFAIDENKACESCFADYTSFENDAVNHPKHYTQLPVECKDVIKHFDSCRGQAIKYIWRCEDKGKPVEDLKKAIFWLNEKIKMYESGVGNE